MSHNPQIKQPYVGVGDMRVYAEGARNTVRVYTRFDMPCSLAARYEKVLRRIGLPFDWVFVLAFDPKASVDTPRYWIQVHADNDACARTGDPYDWDGRPWMLREEMTDSEILRTAFLAVRAAAEHELFEHFRIDGQRPFDPHLNLGRLAEFAADPSNTDQP